MTLDETTSRVESLSTQCATKPGMDLFQPITVSAPEVCRAAAAPNLIQGNYNHSARMEKLAALVVNETERAVNGLKTALPSSETLQDLTRIEANLDEMRRVLKHTPPRSKKGKLFKPRNAPSRAGAQVSCKCTPESSGISPAELANLTIRTASAICEAPVLNFLKPVVGIAEIISETAQTVKANRKAAIELATHSGMVTKAIVEHATTLGLAASSPLVDDLEALVALKSSWVLENIQLYLSDLQQPLPRHRQITSWILANKEKDRIGQFSQGLDKALTLFIVLSSSTTKVLNTHAEVREIATLVRGNDFVEETVTQVRMNTDVLTAMQTDLATALVTVSALASVQSANEGEKKPNTTDKSFPQEFREHLKTLAAAIIMATVYGYEVQPINDHFVGLAEDANKRFSDSFSPGAVAVNTFPILRYLPSWMPGTDFQRFAAECRQLVKEMREGPFNFVKQNMREDTDSTSVVARLLEDNRYDEDAIQDVAGTAQFKLERTPLSHPLRHFFLAMALHPSIQTKAQTEIDTVIGTDRLPGFEDRPSLLYVEALYRELMRWKPVGPLGVAHASTADDGYSISKGTTVISNIWAMTRDKSIYPEPERFNPDRFFTADGKLNDEDTVLAFGFGRRICPGPHTADATLWAAFVSVLATFNIAKAKDDTGKEIEIDPNSYSDGVVSHPQPFACSIILRSETAESLVQATMETHDV
ncbi:O-methylsterigmatocystin oxidoreductase [Mycena sanguinolenta]|uniref:O-methylsterigmatocystin oxidoreductase n=1 Tax=Mycena sanguinolenta TaxID=230812 RepID=A0A8H6ZDY1_9AGAR|nr:O-methylsterigmatocystin oxidoreductase [Mycena sanguinolenta]